MPVPTGPSTSSPTYRLTDLPEIDREKIRINPDTGCWEWTAARTKGGYGQLTRGGRNRRAHRHVYETLVGPLDLTQQLDHRCRVRHCVNPGHLEPVTPTENVHRGLSTVPGDVPMELTHAVLRLVRRAYKQGVYDGLNQARADEQ